MAADTVVPFYECPECGAVWDETWIENDEECSECGAPFPKRATHLLVPLPVPTVALLDTLQAEVTAWAAINAPDATPQTTARHIREEMEELAAELTLDEFDADAAIAEVADLIILAAHLAKLLDKDLAAAVEEKWAVVKQRRYAKGADGVYRHLK